MKKDIVCVNFKKNATAEEVNFFYKNIYNELKKDYYVIGTFENLMEVKPITKEAKILHIEGKLYSTEELLDIIDKATRYEELY